MTKLIGVTLDCKLSWSKHIDAVVAKMGRSVYKKAMRCLLNTINKAGPTGPSFATPWLLFSCVVRCHMAKWLRTGQHGWPLDVHRKLILIICMSFSPGWKWRRDWLHHYFYLGEVLTSWMHRAAGLNYWLGHPCIPHKRSLHSPSPEQTMGGTQYYIEP
jgi:hypothetical protein